ncbi:right-handed parallel beta-helix repeat-containing protein [Arthrobacter sp. zg-Y769]|uniref:right-handed parallel beta-helix repeat-containing protein n=1 Tax=Arthrobacter sp. zg-Y769 TaxID=2894191 RepID=UPI001E3ACB8E|nr:right-handed parallel beta-helix repeat-containing protein [Arthrobacter sp. zg-Y769]MCC9206391.1 right-handed parallel beta-helix repeat-containing protein [Arthrobacter sp. zg-Y769]
MTSRKPLLFGVLAIVFVALVATAFIVAGNFWKTSEADAFGRNEIATNGNIQGELYPGDPISEARIVRGEEERLVYVRTIASAARWRVDGLEGPYRLHTGVTDTLVLPARTEPYTAADLLQLAPDTFRELASSTYMLTENIVVLPGATLALGEGITVRMQSNKDAFVSIVALGGSLTVAGTEESDVEITSWNGAGADTDTSDGRAYVRVIGGHASLSHTTVSSLGFWSGNTGGLALTGTDTAGTFVDSNANAGAEEPVAPAGARLLPEEDLKSLADQTDLDYSVVTAGIDNLTVQDNAFGLFVTNARDIAIRDSSISGSLVDGLVLHRSVTDATVTGTTSSGNAVDGITVGRSSTRVELEDVTANGNGRNGMSFDGQPLADGPNAVGTAVVTYGGNRVVRSTVIDNGRYGVELSGGENLRVTSSTIRGNEVGVVVNYGATGVSIIDNEIRDQRLQGVAVREPGAQADIRRNTISGGDTGVYVRDASATVTSNTMNSLSGHGVSLLGSVPDTKVTGNNVGGYGTVAIWDETSTGAVVEDNDLLDWHPALTVRSVVNSVFQPLTFIWLMLGALLVATAFTRRHHLRVHTIRNPYEERVPLTALSRGIVRIDDVRGAR